MANIKIDTAYSRVSISVKELANAIVPGEGAGTRFRLRADLGRNEHRKRQDFIRRHHPEFNGEYQVSHVFSLGGWNITVRGRPDAVYRENQALVVEEIKTLASAREPFSLSSIETFPSFQAQLDIYCHLLKLAENTIIKGRLHLINIADMGEKDLDYAPNYSIIAHSLDNALSRLAAEAERKRQHHLNLQKAAGETIFPYPAMRLPQERMLDAVSAVVESGDRLMLSAPTGSGKTAGVLFPALMESFRTGRRVFFATSRTTQRHIVRDFVSRMKDSGVPFSALFFTARSKICPLKLETCQPEECAYAADYQSKFVRCGLLSELYDGAALDGEEIRQRVSPLMLCPFFTMLELAEAADLVVGDYNYVFDPSVRLRNLFDEGGAAEFVLIVDEAHSLPGRVRDRYSPELSAPVVEELLAGLKAKSYADRLFKELAKFLRAVLKFIHHHAELELDKTGLSLDTLNELNRLSESLMMAFCLEMAKFGVDISSHPVLSFLREFEWFCKVANMGPEGFAPIYHPDERRLKIACLDSGPVLQAAMASFHSVIAMSATLHPPEFFRSLIGWPESAEILVLPYPFPQENRLIVIAASVSTRYNVRSRFHRKIAEIVDTVYSSRPGGYFCFFPSFAYLQAVEAFIESPCAAQDSAMTEGARNGFLRQVAEGGKIFLAVMGGIFAEGVDYPGQLCGVMVVGPGLPMYCAEIELQRRYFDRIHDAGFEYAYAYPGMNRVVQAAGRLIRSETDRGVIILIGARFTQEPYRSLLPRDWYVEHPGELIAKDLKGELGKFWGRN